VVMKKGMIFFMYKMKIKYNFHENQEIWFCQCTKVGNTISMKTEENCGL